MFHTRIRGPAELALLAALLASAILSGTPVGPGSPTPRSRQTLDKSPTAAVPKQELPRGKKLMLKDGSFQLVREYQIEGDRVRYYSVDSSQWEEMPADLVDWDKTKKVAEEEAGRDAEAWRRRAP